MGPGLSIHVVDATRDAAAAGMRVEVYCLGSHAAKLCCSEVAASGLVEEPILATDAIVAGEYEIVFHVGEFYRRRGIASAPLPFIDAVPFRFGIADATRRFHLPVRVSPWGFAVGRAA